MKELNLSIIIPIYNEESSIERLYNEIKNSLSDNYSYEIIFINDGSTDSSFSNIQSLISHNNKVKLIDFHAIRG